MRKDEERDDEKKKPELKDKGAIRATMPMKQHQRHQFSSGSRWSRGTENKHILKLRDYLFTGASLISNRSGQRSRNDTTPSTYARAALHALSSALILAATKVTLASYQESPFVGEAILTNAGVVAVVVIIVLGMISGD